MNFEIIHCQTTIHMLSHPAYFIKEMRNIKPNTIRLNPTIEQVECIMKLFNDGILRYIELENTVNGEMFTRTLKDITLYENIMIFSWMECVQ